jgi:hypothetical protein
VYSSLRFVTAAALISFGAIIGVGVPVLLLSAVERPLVAGASGPKIPENGASNAVTVEVASAAGTAAEQPLAESRPTAATVPQASAPQAPAPQASAPQASAPQAVVPEALVLSEPVVLEPAPQDTAPQKTAAPEPAQQTAATAPAPAAPVQPPAATERPAAKPAIKAQTAPPAAKKAARRDRIAKKPSTEALNAVRKFGDTLRDIPVSSYAADGTRRTIVIRPTSIQDVYYYSAPR